MIKIKKILILIWIVAIIFSFMNKYILSLLTPASFFRCRVFIYNIFELSQNSVKVTDYIWSLIISCDVLFLKQILYWNKISILWKYAKYYFLNFCVYAIHWYFFTCYALDPCSIEKNIQTCAEIGKFCFNAISSKNAGTFQCGCPPTIKGESCKAKGKLVIFISNLL